MTYFRLPIVIVCLLVLIILSESNAQNIFTGDVLLETQAEVDSFGANNYTEITGNLEIGQTSSSNVTDLTPLVLLTSIGGDLKVSGGFTNLNGLQNITTIGGTLLVGECSYITNIDELSNLSIIGKDIFFEHNLALLTVDGIIGITAVNGSLHLSRNRALTNVDGFKNITSISDSLYLFDNVFINLNGFKNLTTIGSNCEINRNFNLTNIDSLINLTTVGGSIKLHNNQSLTSIDGLGNLQSVGGNLQVTANILVDRFCPLFTLLSGGGLAGTYVVLGNLTNPTITEIIAGGPCITVSIQEDFSLLSCFELNQNYPNPFNPSTKIRFSIPESAYTTLTVYSVLGQEVATLINEEKSSGVYEVSFDGLNLSSGTYIYKLQAGDFVQTKKYF